MTQQEVDDRGGPSAALIRQVENGRYEADMQPAMRAGYEQALRWAPSSIDTVLAGGTPTDLGEEPVIGDSVKESVESLLAQIEEAQAAFERAAKDLATAETEFDTQMRRWATGQVFMRKVEEAVIRRSGELERALSSSEFMALEAPPPPTPAEIAELIAWSAMHDPREWTRYEMALIEYVFDYPTDARAGSTYADIEPFRSRVRRLNPSRASDAGGDQTLQRGTRTVVPDQRLSVVGDQIKDEAAAAKAGQIEDPGEDSI